MTEALKIRHMMPEEIPLAVEWAAAEGWNPGLADAACFAVADPRGFLVAEWQGEPAATLSVVNYDDTFAFLGFYIVRPDLRGRGFGWRLWQAGRAHAAGRTIGLDGVLAQQANYARDGFVFSHRNIRYGGRPRVAPAAGEGVVPLAQVPFAALAASDAAVFPAPREAFLRAWTTAPGHQGFALLRDGRLSGWGVVRPARTGFKIGPLVAEAEGAAERLFAHLAAVAGEGELFFDVPEPNAAARRLAEAAGLEPVFETARMYAGPIRPVDLARLYGVTSFELG
ncbi:GNAT family N-acetyltransferase [Ancylobacter lacus]|uniref:GNAT family N-acetyltransferase n=1 Tax=Ancylobacter lacus TaxID=2579970 RepID=UPI001BD04CEA|nr:GNAT family N-acetyltransferase [Ancylobacter lacus]MBS7540133.1 GNAT family N-acetyltransferase [Ancylobacter lacus]